MRSRRALPVLLPLLLAALAPPLRADCTPGDAQRVAEGFESARAAVLRAREYLAGAAGSASATVKKHAEAARADAVQAVARLDQLLCRAPGSCAADEKALAEARGRLGKAEEIAAQMARQASGAKEAAAQQRAREARRRVFEATREVARLDCLQAP